MATVPIRIMFLGNRRIAWRALKLLTSDQYKAHFDLRVLVTDESIWRNFRILRPGNQAVHITNQQRQTDAIGHAIQSNAIDVLLSIQYNWILPGQILDMVGRRAFNLHNARLPSYKGYNSISHAIANGDTTYDTTVHWMADEVDTGDIAYIARTPIARDDTALTLYRRTVDTAMTAVQSLLNDLAAGRTVPRSPMPNGHATFYVRNSVAAMADVTNQVDTATLALMARAAYFPPNNTAHFFHDGQKYLIVPDLNDGKPQFSAAPIANEPEFDD